MKKIGKILKEDKNLNKLKKECKFYWMDSESERCELTLADCYFCKNFIKGDEGMEEDKTLVKFFISKQIILDHTGEEVYEFIKSKFLEDFKIRKEELQKEIKDV